jgi:cobalt-zinc-cadmium efflux system outer membrane protein
MLVLLFALVAAQDTAAPRLVLGETYAAARHHSPRVAAARALADAARTRIASAKLPPDPQLQLGLMNYALPGLKPMELLGMTQLQLMQMIPVAGKLGLSGRIATAQASAQAERASDVEWELRGAVAMAFYDLYQTDQQLIVVRETLRLLQDIRRTTEAMYRVGEGLQADVLRAQVAIARMVEDTIRMTAMRTGMAARLNALLDAPLDASVGSPVLPAFPDSVPLLHAFVAVAETERPMVKAGEREVDAANAQARLAHREIWPDFTVGLQYGQQTVTMPATDPTMPPERRTERMGSLMIGASIPVFANKRQYRMRQEMTAMQRMAEADLGAMRAETRGKVAEAYANLVRARNLTSLYRNTVIPQVEASVTSALAAYRVGGVDFMTLLDNRMTANNYRQELFALEAEEGKSWAELEMLMGRELFDANDVRGVAATRQEE